MVLEGKIVRQIKSEHYEFQDATGTVEIEIDQKDWQGLTVSEKDTLRIKGEVDRDWKKIKVDVEVVEKL